jgi:hypothetical protein
MIIWTQTKRKAKLWKIKFKKDIVNISKVKKSDNKRKDIKYKVSAR